eukprot:2699985-Prymnesium_polylepis.3
MRVQEGYCALWVPRLLWDSETRTPGAVVHLRACVGCEREKMHRSHRRAPAAAPSSGRVAESRMFWRSFLHTHTAHATRCAVHSCGRWPNAKKNKKLGADRVRKGKQSRDTPGPVLCSVSSRFQYSAVEGQIGGSHPRGGRGDVSQTGPLGWFESNEG